MKHVLIILLLVGFLACKKKETATDPSPVTTTGGTPTVTVSTLGAELTVNSTDYNWGSSVVMFYNDQNIAISVNSVKINGISMGFYPGDKYRYDLASSTFTSAVTWSISSSVSHIPDTSFVSPSIPTIGFQKDISKTFDKTLDFNMTVDASACDSLFCTLGTVTKKIPGKTGITTIIYSPSDNVQFSVTDSTRVDVSVQTLNYSVFKVRGKTWKNIATAKSLSFYKYK